MTYPAADVASFVSDHFEGLKIDMLSKHPDFRDAALGQKVLWAPALIFSNAKGRELRRTIGWLPPPDFLAELRFVIATAQFQNVEFGEARAGFDAIFEENPAGELAPEALYWAGIAGFLDGKRDMEALRSAWERLARDYAGTRWAVHASVIEDVS